MEQESTLSLQAELQQLSGHYKEKEEDKIERLRASFAPIVSEIDELEKEQAALDAQSAAIGKKINDKIESIRKEWFPFISGVEKAQIGFENDLCLVAETILAIGTEDNDKATEWLLGNGYKEVMKWQIHDMTKKKIAREHYEKGEEIPGLTYQKFLKVKIK